jgi:hypothetical protein
VPCSFLRFGTTIIRKKNNQRKRKILLPFRFLRHTMPGMTQAHHIIDALGRAELAARLGVKESAVAKARVNRIMPAAWWRVVKDMAADKGIECPDHVFSWKVAAQ